MRATVAWVLAGVTFVPLRRRHRRDRAVPSAAVRGGGGGARLPVRQRRSPRVRGVGCGHHQPVRTACHRLAAEPGRVHQRGLPADRGLQHLGDQRGRARIAGAGRSLRMARVASRRPARDRRPLAHVPPGSGRSLHVAALASRRPGARFRGAPVHGRARCHEPPDLRPARRVRRRYRRPVGLTRLPGDLRRPADLAGVHGDAIAQERGRTTTTGTPDCDVGGGDQRRSRRTHRGAAVQRR